MEDNTLENMLMIKKKDMEFLNGLMAGSMKANGVMANSMEKEFIPRSMVNMKAFGKMGKELIMRRQLK